MRKETRLYNVLFPLWMLMLFPIAWLVVLPGNFIIDSIVLIVSMYALKMQEKKTFYKKTILKIFGIGILSDIIGSAYMLMMMVVFDAGNIELLLTVPALILSAVCIFLFNYYITFKQCDKSVRWKLALIFAVVTAPYTFLVPTPWLYGY